MNGTNPTWIVNFFHSWPHITFSFTLLPSQDYSFTNYRYYETLAMVALMAVVWLLLTMIVFAIYICCSKPKRKSESTYSSKSCYCSVCAFVVFIMLSLGCIGVAVYGNFQASEGLNVAIVAAEKGNSTFFVVTTQMSKLHSGYDKMHQSVEELKNSLPDNEALENAEAQLQGISEKLDLATEPLSNAEDTVNLSVYYIVTSETYRKIVTLSLLGFQCFLCFLGLLGICCRSKWLIILMIVLGMICVTCSCFYLGVDLTISVAASDFCIDPLRSLHNQTIEAEYLTEEHADYFIYCANPDENMMGNEIYQSKQSVQDLRELISQASQYPNVTEETQDELVTLNSTLESFVQDLEAFEGSVNCKPVSDALKKFSHAMCGTTIEGFFILAVAIFAMTLCMSFIICSASSTVRRYGKDMSRSSSLDDLDYSDPFLPRTTHYSSNSNRNITRTNNPIYATSTSSTTNYGVATNTLSFFRPGSDEDVSLLDSPPPYSPPRMTSRNLD